MSNCKEYYKKNKEKVLKRHSEWRRDNPDYMKKWYKTNSEYDKKRWGNNKEKLTKQHRKWYENNPEYFRKWCENNRVKISEIDKKYYKTEKGKANSQRKCTARRTRLKEIINTLTSKEWLDILEEYNYKCAYCDVEFEVENMPTKDHIIPISKGGHNIKENIVPACRSCNAKKHNKLLSVFIGDR